MQIIQEHPGLLFVIATLLPLLAFVLLFVVGGLRWAARPKRGQEPSALYQFLGGDVTGRTPAYVATGAIGLACVLCVIGFIWHARDMHHDEHEIHQYKEQLVELHAGEFHGVKEGTKEGEEYRKKYEEIEQKIEHVEGKWSGKVALAWIGGKDGKGITGANDPGRNSAFYVGYYIDTLATIMFVMVTFVSTLIFIFSMGYMSDELKQDFEDHQVHGEQGHYHRRGRFGRFFMFLSLFCFSMLNLVLADNLFQIFISWELVGICSYLLIGFYLERHTASTAANKAFITNRIGDAGFIIGLLIIWTYLGTFNFQEIFAQIRAPVMNINSSSHGGGHPMAHQITRGEVANEIQGGYTLNIVPDGSQVVLFPRIVSIYGHPPERAYPKEGETPKQLSVYISPHKNQHGVIPYWLLVVAGLGVFLGCVGKSAQFPLHVWLPDAMEGPTPVSALIHAATMVAAGVYLVGRVYPLFTPEARLVIAYTGGITLFVAATIALVMTDIKKVLAYSTVSQLGYMMLALGVGGWVAGLFHLVTHAFFKALLFLGSGSVIHGCHHEQDMTKMGGLFPKMKITALTMFVGVLTIAGIPLFSGWYSKDAILAQALGFVKLHPEHGLLFLLPLVTAGITTFYMFRMWFLTFTGEPRDHHVHEHAHESPATMTIPLILLAICSICVAWGWPLWDAEASALEHHKHHSQPGSVYADFGLLGVGTLGVPEERVERWPGYPDPPPHEGNAPKAMDVNKSERFHAVQGHHTAGTLALGLVLLGIVFASVVYYYHWLDAAEAKEQFPGVHRFLWNKWYFDEFYSAILVRPALVVAHWCRAFDTHVIDGFIDWLGRFIVLVSKWDGKFDMGVIDGLANLTARVIYAVGGWLRGVQTGFIRSYILFLALAAVGIFMVLSYLLARAMAG